MKAIRAIPPPRSRADHIDAVFASQESLAKAEVTESTKEFAFRKLATRLFAALRQVRAPFAAIGWAPAQC
jgi:hypothetical protein